MSNTTAPTRGDAERAAEALARMDAAQVLLFGSRPEPAPPPTDEQGQLRLAHPRPPENPTAGDAD